MSIDRDKLVFNDSQIESVCMSYRHDFGLIGPIARKKLKSEAKYWLEAFNKELINSGDFDCEAVKSEIVEHTMYATSNNDCSHIIVNPTEEAVNSERKIEFHCSYKDDTGENQHSKMTFKDANNIGIYIGGLITELNSYKELLYNFNKLQAVHERQRLV